MTIHGSGTCPSQSAEPFSTDLPEPPLNRAVLSIADRKRPAERDLEQMLSSALLASDRDLDRLLRKVDEISKALKDDAPDKETLRVAIHPAVWGAVRQALLDRELGHLALTDELTCLYNRRGFFAAATQQLKLARRNQHGLLLFYCDVDDLKKINDSFGNREGDLAIIRAAEALEATFRASDTLARLGRDEFAVLALGASGRSHEMVFRRLESNLKKLNKNESRYQLSLSVGVAELDPKRSVSLGELMSQANLAMHENKRSRVVPCARKLPQPAI